MAPLKHPKQERFVREYINSPLSGLSQAGCYLAAGYRVSQDVAKVNACRLLTNPNVAQRIAELQAPTIRKTKATVETLAEQFDAVFAGAMAESQFGSAGAAAAAKAKLLGFMREKIEVGGVGDFDRAESAAGLVDVLLKQLSPEDALAAVGALGEAVMARAAASARDVSHGNGVSHSDGEAERSLALFRQRRPDPR